jgi:tetratricopeptide (TPR) repeat protein
MKRRLELSFVSLLLAACSTTPPAPPPPAALTHALPEAMVATIRAAAGNDERELAVQPLRDPMVEDLRQAATRLEAQQHYAEAAAALDKALAIVPEDPALLQERAEAALLLKDPATAEALARRAYSLGAKVGPLCRRHWTTVRQTRLLAGDAVGAAQALTQVEACKVGGPNRF